MKVQKDLIYRLELSYYEYITILGTFALLLKNGKVEIETENEKEEMKKIFDSLKG